MKRLLLALLLLLPLGYSSYAQSDTLRLSSSFTTHVIFPSDLSYVDLSDTYLLAAMIVDQSKNVLAIKACQPFEGATSVTAIESTREIHSFIVVYDPSPRNLVVDLSKNDGAGNVKPQGPQTKNQTQVAVSSLSIEDIFRKKQELYHITRLENDIRVSCENIISYGDVLYLTLSLENSSSTDYRIEGATFCIEPRKKAQRTALQPKPVFARNRYGNLSAGPGAKSIEVYSFDKMTLTKGQVLRIYFYEADDQRNLVLEIDSRDINKAQRH